VLPLAWATTLARQPHRAHWNITRRAVTAVALISRPTYIAILTGNGRLERSRVQANLIVPV
jgi:hypothetical protein